MLFITTPDPDPATDRLGRPVKRMPNPALRRYQGFAYRGQPWFRLSVPSLFEGASRRDQQRVLFEALRTCYRERKWLIVANEFEPIVDLGLGEYAKEMWSRGRKREITFVAATQAPRYMPGHMYDQCSHAYLGQVDDLRVQKRFREIGGYSEEVGDAISGLQSREFVYCGRQTKRREIVRVSRGAPRPAHR